MKIHNIIVICCLLISSSAYAVTNEKYLLQWDQGEGHSMANWIWYDDIAYGAKGWILDNDPVLGSAASYLNGAHPSSFDKTDYSAGNDGRVDRNDYAPTKTSGGSLHISPGTATDNRAAWWVWYDGEPLSAKGITDSSTDRMSFYLKLGGTPSVPENSSDFPLATAEIGTYLCWEGTGDSQGNGCPYESPNQHYYHWLTPNSGSWIHVLLDAHPQHIRGVGEPPENEPVLASYGKYYYSQLNQFYIQQSESSTVPTEFWVDEIKFYSTQDTIEPIQNDESVSSLWVGYWAETDTWELGFMDTSVIGDMKKTYEIRWSSAEITNDNWQTATPIQPLNYGGVRATGNANLLSRPNGYKKAAWTKFSLPDSVESPGSKIYFAVKDVSKMGGHIGTVYPYNKGDTVDAANDHVKNIDYVIGLTKSNKPKTPVITGID